MKKIKDKNFKKKEVIILLIVKIHFECEQLQHWYRLHCTLQASHDLVLKGMSPLKAIHQVPCLIFKTGNV